MANPRIYADFQNLDDDNRVKLTCAGTQEDLTRQGIELHEGLLLTLVSDDGDEGYPMELQLQGSVCYNVNEKCWVAEVNWGSLFMAKKKKDQPEVDGGNAEKEVVE